MFNSKKIIAFLLTIALACTFFAPIAKAEGEKKMTGNTKIDYLIEKNLVLGDKSGYRLESNISRQEFATMIVRALGLTEEAKKLQNVPSEYKDMKVTDWSNGYVTKASLEKIVKGYTDQTFKPKKNVSYEEAIKMLVVMMTKEELPIENSQSWALPYIQKAQELGILNEVTIEDYKLDAKRGMTFEMFYNAMKAMENQNLVSYTGIVAENNSTNAIGENNIALVVQKSSNKEIKERDRILLNVKNIKADTEELLGKVIDVKVDENKNVVSYSVNKSYSYTASPVELKNGRIYVKGEANGYRVEEKSDKFDILFGAQLNGENFTSYEDFVKANKNNKIDLAMITSYSGRVLYIRGYNFDDIAPVAEVMEDGTMQIVSDEKNGKLTKVVLKDVKMIDENNNLKNCVVTDIKAGDVVYIYAKDKALFTRMFAPQNESPKYVIKKDMAYLEYKDAKYMLSNEKMNRAVLTLDKKVYDPIDPTKSNSKLNTLLKGQITVSYDIFGCVQMITGDVKFDEGLYIVDAKTSTKIRLVGMDGNKREFSEELGLRVYDKNDKRARFENVSVGDLVYVFLNGDKLNEMHIVGDYANYSKNYKIVDVKNGEYLINLNPSRGRRSTIAVEGKTYEVLPNTVIYAIDPDEAVLNAKSVKLEDIAKNASIESRLQVYAVMLEDFNKMDIQNNEAYEGSKDAVVALVVKDLEHKFKVENVSVLSLKADYNPELDKDIMGYNDNNELKEYKVQDGKKFLNIKATDIVRVSINKENQVVDLERLIFKMTPEYTVESVDYDVYKTEKLTLIDKDGEKKEFYLSKNVTVFGGEYQKGSVIKFSQNEYTDIDTILVVKQ